jgi:MacB-like protein
MLGIPPMLGRTFRPDEDRPGGNRVVVLNYKFWKQRFGGDRNVLGREIALDSQTYTVVGVMPAYFDLWGGQVWIPWQLDLNDQDRQARRFIHVQRAHGCERHRSGDLRARRIDAAGGHIGGGGRARTARGAGGPAGRPQARVENDDRRYVPGASRVA